MTQPDTQPQLKQISCAAITIPEGRIRTVKEHRVQVLRADIDFNGLLQPILVVETDKGFELVDGAHRTAAMRALKRETIAAMVLAPEASPQALRYGEIMANLNREDLTKLERAESLAGLKAAWEAMNPAARHGGDRRSARIREVKALESEGKNQSLVFRLCSDIAEKVGLSRATFFIAVKIATDLTPQTKSRIIDTWIANHQSSLQKLADQSAQMQADILGYLLSDPPQASNVDDAMTLAHGGKLRDSADKVYGRAIDNWGRMSRTSRAAFIETFKDEILKLARAKGWTL